MEKYDAVIEDWYLSEGVIFGNIFDDSKGRFRDGLFIRTSVILPMSMQISSLKQGVVVSTRNSKYLLGAPYEGK